MLTLLTATNHAPWIIPDKHRDKIPEFNSDFKGPFSDSRRTMRYVDFALGEFINQAKKQDWLLPLEVTNRLWIAMEVIIHYLQKS